MYGKNFLYTKWMCFELFLDILQNKLIINTKTLLKEAAEREQRLLTENQDLKQKVGQRSYNPVIDWGTVTLW